MGSELLDYLKEDGTMYLLLGFFLFHAIVAEECPVEKRVGDTCYTRVAIADTNQYGCMENCTYKKTNSSDTGLYCFTTGSLQVTDCGAPSIEIEDELGVVCGSGTKEQYCFQCGKTIDNCEGTNPKSSCILSNSGNCIPRSTTNEFDFGPYMESVLDSLEKFEDNTSPDILYPSPDSCGFFQKIKCLTTFGVGLAGCVSCKRQTTCWLSCLRDKVCGLSSSCSIGGSCFNELLDKVSTALGASGLSAQDIGDIVEGVKNFVCM